MTSERRKTVRVEWSSPATLYDQRGRRARPCIVANFSNGGAKIVGVEAVPIDDEIWLKLTPHSRARKCHVVWRKARALGVEFMDQPVSANREGEQGKSRKRDIAGLIDRETFRSEPTQQSNGKPT